MILVKTLEADPFAGQKEEKGAELEARYAIFRPPVKVAQLSGVVLVGFCSMQCARLAHARGTPDMGGTPPQSLLR